MLEWWQWALAFVAATMTGMSKTGIAGLSVLSVAIYTSVIPARESVGAVLISLLGGDVVAVPSYFQDIRWQYLGRLMIWAAIGVVIGAFALGRIDDSNIRRTIGSVLVLMVLINYVRQYLNRNAKQDSEPLVVRYPWLGWLAGLTAGFFTMIANAAGPIMVLYLLSLRLPKREFIGTSAIFFFAINLFKIPFSYYLGFINPATLRISIWLLPFTMLGAFLGRWLLTRINQKAFEQSALILTLIAGIRLLF
ncbi:MAG: sulfite exporter TauE/SafE family protein [Caldilineaceae bacterium]